MPISPKKGQNFIFLMLSSQKFFFLSVQIVVKWQIPTSSIGNTGKQKVASND